MNLTQRIPWIHWSLVTVFAILFIAATKVDQVPLSRIATNGQNTATAGTAEVIASDTDVASCCVKALAGNSGNVYIGTSTVDSTNGHVLDAGEEICLDVNNTADIFYDVDTSTEGVSFLCVR